MSRYAETTAYVLIPTICRSNITRASEKAGARIGRIRDGHENRQRSEKTDPSGSRAEMCKAPLPRSEEEP